MGASRLSRWGPALAVRDFRLWWLAQMASNISLQMLQVAIGWEVYSLHRSALDLGWIGLAEFVPLFMLALPAGHLADHFPRRLIVSGSLLLGAAVGIGLAVVSSADVSEVWPYLALAAGAGTSVAIGTPAARSMPPTLVSLDLLASAMTLRSIAGQAGTVIGPAIGGLLYAVSATLVYGLAAGFCAAGSLCALAMHPHRAPAGEAEPASLRTVLEGLRFVRRTPVLLGAILLDLLAVLFGGAVALLPVFARSILHVGPAGLLTVPGFLTAGLGILRAAPAVGALLAAAVITRRPIAGRAGRLLLWVVGIYGASIIVFGLSRVYVISLLALAVGGFVDLYSMNIRSTIVALATPDRLRGRVNAIEMVFISASNELGAFESGLAAFLFGTIPAVVGGGAITIALAVTWRRVFPQLAEAIRPVEPEPAELAVTL